MRPQLRPFQVNCKLAVMKAWATSPNVLLVSATGSGKTVMLSDLIADEPGAVCAIAHRQELVGQISLALARNGIRHRIIGSASVRRSCAAAHLDELRLSYVDNTSRVAVAGVNTLVGMDAKDPWFASVKLWVLDEAHHALQSNMWGRAIEMFPNARGLGVTATPCRADGMGLGAWNDGVFHTMVQAPSMREIINMGHLTDYRIFCPPSDLDLSDVDITPSGDFSPKKLSVAVRRSHVTGDVVAHYLRIGPGKLGVTFATDIETASDIAKAFRDAGVPAEVISGKTPDALRAQLFKRFKRREILQLVSVDILGEGVDVPAIEVVSMARPTQSFGLYVQQFGRALRLLDGKLRAIIIDHVGNIMRHGLPDRRRDWSLERREKRGKSKPDEDLIPMTVCVSCTGPYERIYKACPFCGHVVEPASRAAPKFVDGDLHEVDAATLAAMRGDVAGVDSSWVPTPQGAAPYVAAGIRNRHAAKQSGQASLRDAMALWAGWQRSKGHTDSEIYRKFFLVYGTDMLSAQVLAPSGAAELEALLRKRMSDAFVVDISVNSN